MSHCLPGTDLYYLPRDNLEPEKFKLIISPSHAGRVLTMSTFLMTAGHRVFS